jgi:hypothetical protein
MGKYIIPLLIIFIACLILGYCTTGDLIPKADARLTPTTSNQSLFRSNLILVAVDNLAQPTPTLLSVWGVFVNLDKNNSMEIAYKPLYPLPGSLAENEKFDGLFSLESKGGLSAQFQKYLADTYSYPWDNYLVIDRRAVTILSDWITGIPADIQSAKPSNADEEQALVNEQETLLLDICQSLNQESVQGKSPINWQKIIPAHLVTNQSERTFLDNWSLMIKSSKPTKCKILPDQ